MSGVLPDDPNANPQGSTDEFDTTQMGDMTATPIDDGSDKQSDQTAPTQIATAAQVAAAGDEPAQGGGGGPPPPPPTPHTSPNPAPSPSASSASSSSTSKRWLWGGVAAAAGLLLAAFAWPKKKG